MAQDTVFHDESVSAAVDAEIKSNVEDVECLRCEPVASID